MFLERDKERGAGAVIGAYGMGKRELGCRRCRTGQDETKERRGEARTGFGM